MAPTWVKAPTGTVLRERYTEQGVDDGGRAASGSETTLRTGYASKRSLNGGLIASTEKNMNAYTPSANAANVIIPQRERQNATAIIAARLPAGRSLWRGGVRRHP